MLAGCTGTSTPGPSSTGSGSFSAASIATIADYTGSKPGKADPKLSPVTWGYVNQQGGAASYPQYTVAMTGLVKMVNDQLGGIGGHPLKLDTCFVVSSDEDGQTCGQQFVNDKAIQAIVQFPLISGSDAFHKIIDPSGIPLFGAVPASFTDAAGPSFYVSGSNFSTVPIITGYTAQTLKAKSIALIGVQGNPISQLVTGQLTAGLKAAGISVKQGDISATSSDVTAPLIASGAKSADAIVALLPTTSQCVNVNQALKSLSITKPVISIGQCATDDAKKAIGDYPKWTFIFGYPNALAAPLDSRETDEVAVAKNLVTATGAANAETLDGEQALQTFLTALKMVNAGGAATATKATVKSAALAFKGPMFLGPDTVAWGSLKGTPAVATLSQRLYTYTGNGMWVDAGKGWFAVGSLPGPPPAP
ncbi:ABC transporter substrate-binding protein [uncultured Amnibacterium sp.]|uniref:ABC transporter substrate-binding protein n=1 Tax=uncultured Amnibacterium sp. TaxID=1631851 RepID=UPI0035CA99EB